ncbi:protoporphyrinogen oxidase [Allosaccharopolyspora coralli]|uniref:Coproporphyrinogen III oxidase n=1 Tax=Allosaccharopolyspora coralli TaxID=2665642 RepID=A0A5Q3Q4G9_9PSEU|nr:protoporphyrinogen oxidase [Allosaccharopolyspora coralli]QGK69508.1 protoporphyrinogen oxidase [Allosaccharopolyspora coralli]
MPRTVAVVGGGLAGLSAAHRLRRTLGAEARIVLIEQTAQLGGKGRTVELAGAPYDIGAEAFLARRPEVLRLADELGIADEVVAPSGASATIRAGGRTSPLPGGTFMGVPSSAESVAPVLSEQGLATVRAEQDLPPVPWSAADVSLGLLLRERMGDEVVDRLVDPLLGGVYAGSADGLGLRAVAPALASALDAGAGSVTEAARASVSPAQGQGPKAPVFGAFRGGYRRLADELVRQARPEVRCGCPVRSLVRRELGWRLEIGSAPAPDTLETDAVVLAVPPPSARKLLTGVAPVAAEAFAEVDLASMVVLGLALPPETTLPDSSGVLIARGETRADGTRLTAKAFTFSSRKWPHLRGAGGEVLVRGSVGRAGEESVLRLGDSELLDAVIGDLADLTGVRARPVETVVARWGGGLPQYGVGHGEKVAEIERCVSGIPGLAVAGAALHGVGVPACLATGEAAAADITGYLLGSGRDAVGP